MSEREEWVEVIGLPGCGKTTFVRNNLKQIELRYKVIESRYPTLASRIRARVLYEVRFKNCGLPEPLARKLAYRLSFRPAAALNKPFFFFDSGVLQLALEYLIENDFSREEHLFAILSTLPLPGKLIYMSDDLEKTVEREHRRADRRYPDLGAEELRRRYKAAEQVMEQRIFPLAVTTYPVNLSKVADISGVSLWKNNFQGSSYSSGWD